MYVLKILIALSQSSQFTRLKLIIRQNKINQNLLSSLVFMDIILIRRVWKFK